MLRCTAPCRGVLSLCRAVPCFARAVLCCVLPLELSVPQDASTRNTATALLLLPLLVLLPYPVELLVAMQNMPDPIPF